MTDLAEQAARATPPALEGLSVRALSEDDWYDYAQLMQEPGVLWGTLQTPYLAPETYRKRVQGIIASNGAALAAVLNEHQLIGSLTLMQQDRSRRAHVAALGMAVSDAMTGKGVGTTLLKTGLRLADDWLNIARIELTVFADNVPAIRLYERAGFAVEGTARSYALRAGRFTDALHMARLRPTPHDTALG